MPDNRVVPLARRRPRTNVEDLLVEAAVKTALDSGDPTEADAIMALADQMLTEFATPETRPASTPLPARRPA